MLACGELDSAWAATDELGRIAAAFDSPYLAAVAGYAHGSVLLAAGDPAGARAALAGCWRRWLELETPYEAARSRRQLGLARARPGDPAGARIDWDGAREVFARLGASPDLARLAELVDPPATGRPDGLTAREVEVLGQVAAGRSNREIADALVVSEHTV